MYIDQGMPNIEAGELPVTVNGHSDSLAASVCLIRDGRVRILIDSDEDADRLIRAIVTAKRKRAAAASGRPHAYAETVADGRCDECGLSMGSKIHAEPVAPVLEDETDAATVLAEAIRNGTPVIVTDDAPVLEGMVTSRPQDAPYAPVLNGAGRGTAG